MDQTPAMQIIYYVYKLYSNHKGGFHGELITWMDKYVSQARSPEFQNKKIHVRKLVVFAVPNWF